jgi:hypothetical protein
MTLDGNVTALVPANVGRISVDYRLVTARHEHRSTARCSDVPARSVSAAEDEERGRESGYLHPLPPEGATVLQPARLLTEMEVRGATCSTYGTLQPVLSGPLSLANGHGESVGQRARAWVPGSATSVTRAADIERNEDLDP